MDKDVKFLIGRMDEKMDKLEDRLIKKFEGFEKPMISKIEDLQAFKNRWLGMAAAAGCLGAVLIEAIYKHI